MYTEAEEAAMWAELAKLERRTLRKLFWALLFGEYDKGVGAAHAIETLHPFWRYWIYRRLCGLAILLGRSYSDKDKSYDYETLAWANLSKGYADWHCDTIAYNPKSFRYELSSDGDSSY